jgi:putative colanic acid biosynthesis glycosyltransferase
MKLFQINTSLNSGSTGRIAEDIGSFMIVNGHQSFIAAGYTNRPSTSEVIKIGGDWNRRLHGLKTRLFDRHGFGSGTATRQLIECIEVIDPDIIHLHNIHGYYLNVEVLFSFLKNAGKPIVWTLHDCWPFTGHCSHFESVNCDKWQTECRTCPNKKGYPASWLLDNSRANFKDKMRIFNGVKNLHFVTPSHWLAEQLKKSFLKNYMVSVIYNGIDLGTFKPGKTDEIKSKYGLTRKIIILGVANTWKKRKAFNDFIKLSKLLPDNQQIVLVGLSGDKLLGLPDNITGTPHTENIAELAAMYSAASVFVNPTYVDNFPTTNIESLACGTPVITYNTGGSPEAADVNTGLVVEKGDIEKLAEGIKQFITKGKEHYHPLCRKRAENCFDKSAQFEMYAALYQKILQT